MIDLSRLQHNILATLRRAALTISHHGNQREGTVAIHKMIDGTAQLQFGVLVALLNDWDRYTADAALKQAKEVIAPTNPLPLNQYRLKREEIEITKYSFEEVAMAVELLEFNEDVKDYMANGNTLSEDRVIQLTNKGAASLNSQYYLKADIADAITNSTLATNKAVQDTAKATRILVYVTVGVILATLATPIVGSIVDGQKAKLEKQIEQLTKDNQILKEQHLNSKQVLNPSSR